MRKNLLTFLGLVALLFACDKEEAVDCNDSAIEITNVAVTNASCNASDGSITATTTGGENLQYSIDGTTFQASGTFANVASGSYMLTVRDANGCKKEQAVTIPENNDLILSVVRTENAGCKTSAGAIEVAASGGEGDLTFSLDGSDFQPSTTFSSISAGAHTVRVRDVNGCTTSKEIRVMSGVSFKNSVKSIIDTNCAVSGCHVAGTGRQDFTQFSVIQQNGSNIKRLTQNKSMPKDGSLTQSEIDAIACWVDDGALNN